MQKKEEPFKYRLLPSCCSEIKFNKVCILGNMGVTSVSTERFPRDVTSSRQSIYPRDRRFNKTF